MYNPCILVVMETMNKVITQRKPAFITAKAYKALPRLSKMLADEKGVSSVTFIDALSIAVAEAIEKREAEKKAPAA